MCHKIEMETTKQSGTQKHGIFRGNDINWNHLFYFCEAAANGSIKEAAHALGLSPSTLSEQIAQLEKDLQVMLFHRQHRKIALTEEGQRLFAQAKAMFETGKRLVDVISPLPLGCYPVSIGIVPSSSLQIAHDIVSELVKRSRQLNVKIRHARATDFETSITRGELDFGFSDSVPERKNLSYKLVSSSTLRFFVSENLKGKSVSELLRDLPVLLCNSDPSSLSFTEKLLKDSGLALSSTINCDYPSVITELCRRGQGVAVFSDAALKVLNFSGITALESPAEMPRISENLYVVWASESENTQVIALLRDILKTRIPKEFEGTPRSN